MWIALIASAFSALVATTPTLDQVRVPYGDLNLSQTADARAFSARVDAAAQESCNTDAGTHRDWQAFNACRKDARDRLIAALPVEKRTQYESSLRG